MKKINISKVCLSKHKFLFFLSLLMELVSVCSLIFLAFSLELITNFAVSYDESKLIYVILIGLGSCFANFLSMYLTSLVETTLYKKLNNDLYSISYKYISSLDLDIRNQYDNNYYVSMFVNDLQTLTREYFVNIIELVSCVVLFILSSVYLFFISYIIALIVLVCGVLIVLLPLLTNSSLQRSRKKYMSSLELFTDKITDSIAFYSLIKLYKIEEYDQKNVNKSVTLMNQDNKKFTHKANTIKAFTVLLSSLSQIVSFIMGSYLASKDIILVGSLVASVQISSYIVNSISGFMGSTLGVVSCKPIIEKVNAVLNLENRNKELRLDVDSKINIDVKDLSYSYDGKDKLFNNLSFHINENEKVLIKGGSGKGKSTLFKLLMGFYSNYLGSITLQGKEVKDIDNSLYSKCVLVSQDSILFNDSLKNNILLGMNISDDQLNSIIKLSRLDELVSKLNNGLEEKIVDNGSNFSGGEKQRINLARALVRNPKILFLDESFSALDNKTEEEIRKDLFSKNITIIEIAHKINNNFKYDKEIVL